MGHDLRIYISLDTQVNGQKLRTRDVSNNENRKIQN